MKRKSFMLIMNATMALVLATSMSACAKAGNPNSQAPSASDTAKADGEESIITEKDEILQIGINQFAPHPSLDNCSSGFIAGLEEEGFKDGENIKIDVQNAQGDPATANSISANFVSKKYDLICGVATPSAQAAFNAAEGKDIPVVFSAVTDPLAAKIIKTLEKPEYNCTGTSDTLNIDAQLKMIREFLPEAKKIGILYTTGEVNSISQLSIFKELAPNYGFEIVEKGISISSDINMALDSIVKDIDCMTNLNDNTVVNSLPNIIEKTNSNNIPVFGSEEEQLKSGCIASETLNYFSLGVETGKMAAKILKGENAAEMPVKIISDSKPVVNKEACEKLGITIPAEYIDAL